MKKKMSNLNIRIEDELRWQFEDFCEGAGMSVSTAINVFIKQVVKRNKIPFEIIGDELNEETLQAIREVEDIKRNPDNYKSYTSVKEMMDDINNEI